MVVSACRLSLSKMFWRFIHVMAYISTYSYLWLNNIPLHLGFYFLNIRNNAAVNIHMPILIWTYVFIFHGYVPRSGVALSYDNSVFNFLRIANLFSTATATPPFYSPYSICEGPSLSISLPTLVIACVFDYSHSMGMKRYLIVVRHNSLMSVWCVLNFKILFLLCTL